MHGNWEDIGGPGFEPGLVDVRGRLTRLLKGGDNSGAIAEQQAARKQSAEQFAIQMRLQMQQAKLAAAVKPPVIYPVAAPQTVDQNTLDQRREAARQAQRRFSFQTTMNPGTLGGSPVTGGGAP